MVRYAIGDVQGCMTTLEKLLAELSPGPGDELWLVGDLVNRGPRSLDVLRWAMREPRVTCVLGNHDLHLLARVAGVAKRKQRDTLDDILAAADRDVLIDWLRQRPFVVVDDARSLAMVHAGLHPYWTVADARARARELEAELRGPGWRPFLGHVAAGETPAWHDLLSGPARWRAILSYLVRVRTCRRDGSVEADYDGPPANAPPGCIPWFALPAPAWATHQIVFGHWAALGLSLGPHHAGLDTGCVWGRTLTALRVDDGEVIQVAAIDDR
jgi:bis(5'-nucleosyl)-tetraphosphatase (symmetrical)